LSQSGSFTENQLEEIVLKELQNLGYDYAFGPDIAHDGSYPERMDYREVILPTRVKEALYRINKGIPPEALEEAYRQLIVFNSPKLEENNRHFHELMTEGMEISFKEKGNIRTKRVYIIDFEHLENNDFLAVNQFTVVEREDRRPDVVLFVNGLPLVVMEIKSASDEKAGVLQAYNQIQTYKRDIPSLFNYNAFCILTDGVNAKAGTITSNEERYMNWRTEDGEEILPLHYFQYKPMIRGMLNKERLVDIIKNFILFHESKEQQWDEEGKTFHENKSIIKIMAAYHQYYAVKKAIDRTIEATKEDGDRKVGVIWHTQGSGKSLSMVFYTGELINVLNNPTIVVITDRNDLDDQLYKTFAQSEQLLRQKPQQAHVRRLKDHQKVNGEINGLYDLLNARESGGIIFTTIQKFQSEEGEMPVLTDRKNVIIIADEAHRSQYGLEAKANEKTGEVKYGYAKHLRDALPNASFIGFTGTPIDLEDRSTTAVFGHTIDTYDMTRAVEDESTVRIYYENRIIKLDAVEEELKTLDEEFEEITEGEEDYQREKHKTQWSRLETIVGSPNRIQKLAADLVHHYEEKSKTIKGKAMAVCMSRRICVELYEEIIKLRPDWHSDEAEKGKIKVVMTGSAADSEKYQQHLGGKRRRDLLAKRMKDEDDELKIVIVRDMWLTGFDVPSMHTMYIDKPMKGHNLMQAIARVNRVFKDKSGGVIVDYLGIFESLKKALSQYTDVDRKNTGIDTSVAVAIMREKLEILQDMMHGYDYTSYLEGDNTDKIEAIQGGMNHVLSMNEMEQKDYKKFTIELAKAHALCSAMEEGKAVALEVSYFKAVKASLAKLQQRSGSGPSTAEIEARLNQMLQRSIISEEVVDVFSTLGMDRPDVSILSDEFLEEIKNYKHKNLAVEMLKKLLEGNIKLMERKNLVKSELFSEKLQKALNKYRNQAITNLEVIQELINMARDMKNLKEAEKELGLTEDEIAFYDALTNDEVVRDFLEDETLKKIAQELTITIKNNLTIDWSVRKSAQAGMRRIVKRLLKKYDYPPKQATKALQIVMKQAEQMCGNVSKEEIYENNVSEEYLTAAETTESSNTYQRN